MKQSRTHAHTLTNHRTYVRARGTRQAFGFAKLAHLDEDLMGAIGGERRAPPSLPLFAFVFRSLSAACRVCAQDAGGCDCPLFTLPPTPHQTRPRTGHVEAAATTLSAMHLSILLWAFATLKACGGLMTTLVAGGWG